MDKNITVHVGSQSQIKNDAIYDVFSSYFSPTKITLIRYDVASGVPSTPYGPQTQRGAKNRVTAVGNRIKKDDTSYIVGVESGLLRKHGLMFEETWACIRYGAVITLAYSSGFPVPSQILDIMNRSNAPHFEVMGDMQNKQGYLENDTWAVYSANAISRSTAIAEAVRNALIQHTSPFVVR